MVTQITHRAAASGGASSLPSSSPSREVAKTALARTVWEAIKNHPGTEAYFLDGEAEIRFPPELLTTVCELAGARKKRQLTEEQKEKLRGEGKGPV